MRVLRVLPAASHSCVDVEIEQVHLGLEIEASPLITRNGRAEVLWALRARLALDSTSKVGQREQRDGAPDQLMLTLIGIDSGLAIEDGGMIGKIKFSD